MKHKPYYLLAGIAIFLMLAFSAEQAEAKKLSRYYSSFLQDIGTIYHILPIESFSAKKPAKELQFDLTYLDSRDSVTMNFSYLSTEILVFDSVFLMGENTDLSAPLEKIYISSKKSVWTYRYGTHFKYDDMQRFFASEKAPVICLKDKNGIMHVCTISQGKWDKSTDVIRQIFTIINLNRKE